MLFDGDLAALLRVEAARVVRRELPPPVGIRRDVLPAVVVRRDVLRLPVPDLRAVLVLFVLSAML